MRATEGGRDGGKELTTNLHKRRCEANVKTYTYTNGLRGERKTL